MLEDSSLADAIGVVELTDIGNRIQAAFNAVEMTVIVGVSGSGKSTLLPTSNRPGKARQRAHRGGRRRGLR